MAYTYEDAVKAGEGGIAGGMNIKNKTPNATNENVKIIDTIQNKISGNSRIHTAQLVGVAAGLGFAYYKKAGLWGYVGYAILGGIIGYVGMTIFEDQKFIKIK